MARIVLTYSVPVRDRGERLDGELSQEVRCYRNEAVTVQANVFRDDIDDAMTKLVPEGYFLVDHPTVVPDPPKTGYYRITSVGRSFSAIPLSDVIVRPDGEVAVSP